MIFKKILQQHQELIWCYIRYNSIGLVCTAIYIVMNVFFVQFLHLNAVLSVSINFFIYIALAYALNSFWVFKKRMQSIKHKHALSKFITVSIISFFLNIGIMFLTVNVLKLWYFYGLIFATFVVPTANFIMHNFWSFKVVNNSKI